MLIWQICCSRKLLSGFQSLFSTKMWKTLWIFGLRFALNLDFPALYSSLNHDRGNHAWPLSALEFFGTRGSGGSGPECVGGSRSKGFPGAANTWKIFLVADQRRLARHAPPSPVLIDPGVGKAPSAQIGLSVVYALLAVDNSHERAVARH